MIRSTISVVIILVATIVTAEKNVPALRTSNDNVIDHRNLQIELGDDICPPLEDLFQNLVVCECDVEIDYPIVLSYSDIKCVRPICDPFLGTGVCVDVTFATNVTLGPIAVGAAICLEDISVLGFPIPGIGPFCIDYVLSQESIQLPALPPRAPRDRKDKKNKHGKDKHDEKSDNRESRRRVRSVVDSCTAVMSGVTCNSCTPCDRRGSVHLDCTNAIRSFKTEKCTKFRPYLGPGSQPNSTIPKIFYEKK